MTQLSPLRITAELIHCCTGLALCLLSGCAGPATPMGALWITTPHGAKAANEVQGPESEKSGNSPSIRFMPARQVLHGPRPMTVVIEDPAGIRDNYKLNVLYNGMDVTRSFLRQAQVSRVQNGHKLLIKIPVVRLSPDKIEHRIEVRYNSQDNSRIFARLKAPRCHMFKASKVLTTEEFEPSQKILQTIEAISRQNGFNPSMMTGLVAQESGFNPDTVSWARAIGLTQITPIAESELAAQGPRWPRYPGLNKMPVPWVKTLINQGDVNSGNEWRLNPELSILGGVSFLEILSGRWSTAENRKKIQELALRTGDPDTLFTQLMLASYNSGYARVSSALQHYGVNWLSAPELNEARKYVNRIFSYCNHFSEERTDHETAA